MVIGEITITLLFKFIKTMQVYPELINYRYDQFRSDLLCNFNAESVCYICVHTTAVLMQSV